MKIHTYLLRIFLRLFQRWIFKVIRKILFENEIKKKPNLHILSSCSFPIFFEVRVHFVSCSEIESLGSATQKTKDTFRSIFERLIILLLSSILFLLSNAFHFALNKSWMLIGWFLESINSFGIALCLVESVT